MRSDERATELRAAFGLKASDAIHAATAILAGVSEFWTADRDFSDARNSKLSCSTRCNRVGSSANACHYRSQGKVRRWLRLFSSERSFSCSSFRWRPMRSSFNLEAAGR